MKNLFYCAVILFLSGVVFSGCYYDKEAILYPPGTSTCDTVSASLFASTVMPILNANCNSCHGGAASAGAGVALDNYSAVLVQVNNGKLMGDITHATGYVPMPMGGNKLSDCNIAKIQKWINSGKLNN
jgi:hypothetical protein